MRIGWRQVLHKGPASKEAGYKDQPQLPADVKLYL